jgi:hypothetical protein
LVNRTFDMCAVEPNLLTGGVIPERVRMIPAEAREESGAGAEGTGAFGSANGRIDRTLALVLFLVVVSAFGAQAGALYRQEMYVEGGCP